MVSRCVKFTTVLLISFSASACLSYATLQDEYDLMPPVFLYENMSQCFERHSDGLYCVTKTVIRPNDASEIWRAIEKFSKRSSYHEHSLLDRGLCVDECVRLVETLDPSIASQLDTQPVPLEPYLLLTLPSDTSLSQYQVRYGKVLNICVNYHLWQRYNLTGYTELEHCLTPETLPPPLDVYHLVFVLVVVLLLALVTCATYADLRKCDPTAGVELPLWMEFSLRRSWSELIGSSESTLRQDFAFLGTIRLLFAFLILTIHVTIMYSATPTDNIRQVEEFFNRPVAQIVTSIFPFQVHTFFAISGILMAVYFLKVATLLGRRGWALYPQAIVVRYLRIFPTLFIVWLFQASWIDQLSQGPADYRYFELERDNCRSNGWLNFLFLNNYFRYSNMCIQQSWYLAAEFQMFMTSVPLLLLIHRHPKLTMPLAFVAASFSIIAPIVNLYHWKLPGLLLTTIKHVRFFSYTDQGVKLDYMLSHANTCSYFSGIFAGVVYHRLRNGSGSVLDGRKKLLQILTWGPTAMVVGQASLAPLFYRLDYSEPMLWNAIYGAVHRCSWGAMIAVGLLRLATTWRGRLARIHSHPVVLAFSRLSFCMFMVQFSLLKTFIRNAPNKGHYFSWENFFSIISYTLVVNYAIALLFALVVEIPFKMIFKRVLFVNDKEFEKKNEHKTQ